MKKIAVALVLIVLDGAAILVPRFVQVRADIQSGIYTILESHRTIAGD